MFYEKDKLNHAEYSLGIPKIIAQEVYINYVYVSGKMHNDKHGFSSYSFGVFLRIFNKAFSRNYALILI